MRPLSTDRHADVHPVTGEPARLCGALADPGDQGGHFVPGQECFQAVDLTVLHRALRQDNDIDGTAVVSGCGKRPVHEIQVEPFGRSELEEAERITSKPLQRPGYWAEI